jgi:hypothetical protein
MILFTHHHILFRKWSVAALPLLVHFLAASGLPAAAQSPAPLGPGRILTSYGGPRVPLAGDADGDGKADFLGVYQPDGIIDYMRTADLGKPLGSIQARTDLGHNIVAAACMSFSGVKGVGIAAVLTDGSVRVAYDMNPADHKYRYCVTAAAIPKEWVPRAPLQTAVADFNGDGQPDLLVAGADGKAVVLRGSHSADGSPHFDVSRLSGLHGAVRRLGAGPFAEGTQAVWLDSQGVVRRGGIKFAANEAEIEHAQTVATASPDDGLCVGRFQGLAVSDVIVGQRLLPGGNAGQAVTLPQLPGPADAKSDVAWLAADFNGDGKDDLLRCRRSKDPLNGDNDYLYYATTDAAHAAQQFGDEDNDGLLDSWETGAVKPGGLDLAALGCSTQHADIIIEVQPFADVPMNVLNDGLQKAQEYFATIPIHNPDGTDGIAMHFIMREPIPNSEGSAGWEGLHEKYHARSHRGITHWMLIYKGGGGQSGGWGEGGQSGCYGMPGVFIHELGHQLGLDHTGRWPLDHNPLYHSIMNYCYNYALDKNGRTVGYSHGSLDGIVLDPHHLSERLPVPADKVQFMAGPPYNFRIKPSEDGRETLVDWNWNGVFGEANVAADINYAYSTTAGERHRIGKSYTVPAIVSAGSGHAARLLVVYGRIQPGPALASAPAEAPHTLSDTTRGVLMARLWKGKDTEKDGASWTDEIPLGSSAITGDPAACWHAGAVWTAYPTPQGVEIRRLTLEGDTLHVGDPTVVPDSAGAQPTLTPLHGSLALLLWRGRTTPVGVRLIAPSSSGPQIDAEVKTGVLSNVPVGAAAGSSSSHGSVLWVGGTADQGTKKSRWQVHKLAMGSGGTVKETSAEWIGGDAAGEAGEGRISLLWEPNHALGDDGQLFVYGRGGLGLALTQEFVAMRIADKHVHGGWLTRRYYDEWTNSRLSCGVCWFRGDIAYASNMFGDNMDDNNLIVAFYGRGIQNGKMGDFDDIGFIRDYGLRESIGSLTE